MRGQFKDDFDGKPFAKWSDDLLREYWNDRFEGFFDHSVWAADKCESPIEKRMLIGLIMCGFGYYSHPNEVVEKEEWEAEKTHAVILPQWKHAKLKYRVDFMVSLWVPGEPVRPRFIIECDGHDFHERTKEQAARDRKRDRDFAIAGVPFLRFTGSEIVRSLSDCMDQVETFGCNLIEEAWVQAGHNLPWRGK